MVEIVSLTQRPCLKYTADSQSSAQVAERGRTFVAAFGSELRRRRLPLLFCEAWTFSACLALAAACARALPPAVRPPSREASPAAAPPVPAKAVASGSPRHAHLAILCTSAVGNVAV